jgi:hypothetical protein
MEEVNHFFRGQRGVGNFFVALAGVVMYNEGPDFRGSFMNVNRVGILMRTIHYFIFNLTWLFLCSVCFGYTDGGGTASDPYQISNHDDLLELANTTADYSKYFVLTADIDMQGQVFTTAIIAKDTNAVVAGFQGIAFAGTLDGGGHKITNFAVNGGSDDFLGLFGRIESGAVKNLGLENCAITYTSNSDFIGGLAGYNFEASISHCYMAGDVSGDSDSFYIGGLVGINFQGVIDRCYTTGKVAGLLNATYIGGLAGLNGYDGIITYCYSTGTMNGDFEVGGLCGDNGGLISHCYAAGDVAGPDKSFYLGGLCGSNFGTIDSCYATGAVSGGNESLILGGLCGENSSTETLINCYATGSVTAGDFSSTLGGLCGENYYGAVINCYSTGAVAGGSSSILLGGLCGYQTDGEINNSFWDIDTSNMTVGYNRDAQFPGTITNVVGKTTIEMQTLITFTAAGWDFTNETANGTEDIWRMCEDGIDYPRLTWQSVAGDILCPAGVGAEDLDVMIGCWLSVIRASADINSDNAVNLADFSMLAQYWQEFDCGLCNGADVTGDSNVDSADLTVMIDKWLVLENAGCRMADLNTDDEIDLKDVAIFAGHWLEGI